MSANKQPSATTQTNESSPEELVLPSGEYLDLPAFVTHASTEKQDALKQLAQQPQD